MIKWLKSLVFPVICIVLWLQFVEWGAALMNAKSTILNTIGVIIIVTCLVAMFKFAGQVGEKFIDL